MNIDWSKAPDWAVGYALHAFGGEIREVWVGEHQYQRLDQPKPFPYGGGNSDHRHNSRRSEFHFEQLRPAPWTGKGLPPVGTVCEHRNLIPDEEWTEVEIVAHRTFADDDYPCAVFVYSQSSSHSSSGDHFRPIRTPEQIEAEEREAAHQELMHHIAGYMGRDNPHSADDGLAKYLLDHDYRKQPSP